MRNTKVIDIYKALKEYNVNIVVYDPWVDPAIAKHEYDIEIVDKLPSEKADAIILAVAHDIFNNLNISPLVNERYIVFDIKGNIKKNMVDERL